MRYLGIDYGLKRTGVAISDESAFLACGLRTVTCNSMTKTAEECAVIARKNRVSAVVIGMPLNMNGSECEGTERVRVFGKKLEELSDGKLEIIFFDERLTTVQAHELLSEMNVSGKKRKKVVDTLSAELILQSFLDERRKEHSN